MFDFEKKLMNRILKEELTKIGIEGLIPLGNGYVFGIETEGSNSITIIAELDKHNLRMFSILDEHADIEDSYMMSNVGEFFHRVNIRMITGKFTLDYDDGTIMFYSSHTFCEILPESDIYDKMLIVLCMMLDQFLPGIRDIINGVKSPVEAFDECENNGVVEAQIKKRLAKLLEKLSEEDGDEITDYDKSPTESDTTEISFSKSFEEMLKHLREDDFSA